MNKPYKSATSGIITIFLLCFRKSAPARVEKYQPPRWRGVSFSLRVSLDLSAPSLSRGHAHRPPGVRVPSRPDPACCARGARPMQAKRVTAAAPMFLSHHSFHSHLVLPRWREGPRWTFLSRSSPPTAPGDERRLFRQWRARLSPLGSSRACFVFP